MRTFQSIREIIERFDLLYPNKFPFAEKLRFLFGFERSLFLSTYLIKKPDITIDKFAESEPIVKAPHDDIYIKALIVKMHLEYKDMESLGQAVVVLAEAVNQIKYQTEHQLFEDITDGG